MPRQEGTELVSTPTNLTLTLYPPSPPLEDQLEHFWDLGDEFPTATTSLEPPQTSLALLEELGPSPFERGRFPLIGFLATTYEKVSRFGRGNE